MPSEEKTWGAGLIGLVVAVMLYGITNVQTYYYALNYKHDPSLTKLMVAVLWILDTAHTAIITHAVYYYVIIHFADPSASIVWSLPTEVFLTSTIAFMVQCYLIRRVWCMSGGLARHFLVVLLFLVAACGLGSGFAYGVRLFQIKLLPRVPEIVDLIDTALGSTMATDALLTLSLSYLLHRSRSGLASTDRMINNLILFTVNNGLLTSLCAMLDVIVHKTLPTTFAFLSFYFLLSKLYVNTFLATLNARRSISGKGEFDRGYRSSYQLDITKASSKGSRQSQTVLNDSVSADNSLVKESSIV